VGISFSHIWRATSHLPHVPWSISTLWDYWNVENLTNLPRNWRWFTFFSSLGGVIFHSGGIVLIIIIIIIIIINGLFKSHKTYIVNQGILDAYLLSRLFYNKRRSISMGKVCEGV
jgi:hypothetical protein